MRQVFIKRRSVFIAGTALLGALVIVLDQTWKFIPGLKIPFVLPLAFLRFDVLGIPMLLWYFLFGFVSGGVTSLISWFSISFRDTFGGFMEFLAEFSTIIGVYLVLRFGRPITRWWKALAMASGILVRVLVMAISNIMLLPIFTRTTIEFVITWIHLILAFNIIQGAISVFGGFLVYEAIILRLPSLKTE